MRTLLLGFLVLLALTSCTGAPAPDGPTGAAGSNAPVPTPTHGTRDRAAATTPVASLPCPRGVPRRLVGARHQIVRAVFAPRLTSPPSRQYRNKILWTSEQGGSADLLVAASLNGTDRRVRRRVEGDLTPGPSRPSIINVPAAGCWTFSLRWGTASDLVAVSYGRPR